MKHTNTIVNIVLAISIIVLYILHFCGKDSSCDSSGKTSPSSSAIASDQLPIAYINIDSLLLNYTYSKDLNEVLIRKRENAQATLTQKARQLDAEMKDFQRKHENNAFLSEQSFKNQQQALVKKQQDLQVLEENLTQELVKEQQKMNEQLRDSIYKFLISYNKDKKYQMILSNTMNDNIMVANPTYNITDDVVKILNKKYKKTED
ncbi:MAG: OmpH family outer membrane protein [Bacteroidales bacterium]|nr:OmpH family outer membrane protein [Bacteroidales bacterium]